MYIDFDLNMASPTFWYETSRGNGKWMIAGHRKLHVTGCSHSTLISLSPEFNPTTQHVWLHQRIAAIAKLPFWNGNMEREKIDQLCYSFRDFKNGEMPPYTAPRSNAKLCKS
jgi:hypothetical protein